MVLAESGTSSKLLSKKLKKRNFMKTLFASFILTSAISCTVFSIGNNPCSAGCLKLMKTHYRGSQSLNQSVVLQQNPQILVGSGEGYSFQDLGQSIRLTIVSSQKITWSPSKDGRFISQTPQIIYSTEFQKGDPRLVALNDYIQSGKPMELQIFVVTNESLLGTFNSVGDLFECARGLQFVFDYEVAGIKLEGFHQSLNIDIPIENHISPSQCAKI
jgi:hypothetical protein